MIRPETGYPPVNQQNWGGMLLSNPFLQFPVAFHYFVYWDVTIVTLVRTCFLVFQHGENSPQPMVKHPCSANVCCFFQQFWQFCLLNRNLVKSQARVVSSYRVLQPPTSHPPKTPGSCWRRDSWRSGQVTPGPVVGRFRWWYECYPLVMTNIAIENHHF
jgi:hypothetical protein